MLIWEGEINGGANGGAAIGILDSAEGPRTLAQFRALLALTVGGISREELDELAAVSNGPAVIHSLDALGFRVGRGGKPTAAPLIWSGGGYPGRSSRKYQYALTPLGVQVMGELVQSRRTFRNKCFGYTSYFQALILHERLFAHAAQLFRDLLSRNGYTVPREVGA